MLDALSQQDTVTASDRRLEVVRHWRDSGQQCSGPPVQGERRKGVGIPDPCRSKEKVWTGKGCSEARLLGEPYLGWL